MHGADVGIGVTGLPYIGVEELIDAIRAGVADAFREMYAGTDMPTADLYDTIKEGVKEAFDQLWASQIQDAITAGVKEAMGQ